MGLFNINKKTKSQICSNNFVLFSEWLDKLLEDHLPDYIIALNFNIYEGSEKTYDIQLIGSDVFDEDDSDWACNELFTSGENICYITRTNDIQRWEDGLIAIKEIINKYLIEGKYSKDLKKYKAIGVGFVDGDLEIIQLNK